jgi:hypothetical protein
MFRKLEMLRHSCYNNDGSENIFLCVRMVEMNIRGGKKNKVGEKGDDRCYFPCKKRSFTCPVRILMATSKKHCRKYEHTDGGSNEYHPVVINYIFIICFYIDK